MFYVWNVREWISEVITACGENHLNTDDSIFVLVLFSSLDFEYVEFFRDHKNQVSSYSGRNVHIFTPIIYQDVVPDDEWRLMRDDLEASGIQVGSGPSVVFFRIRGYGATYEPRRVEFFAAYRLPSKSLVGLLRHIVDACIEHRPSSEQGRAGAERLIGELARVTESPNLLRFQSAHSHLASDVQTALDQPRLFLSHSSADKPFVRRFCEALRAGGLTPWIDEVDLGAGDSIRAKIELALRDSDVLLVFLSAAAAQSHWVQYELAFFAGAADTGRIVPVIIDDDGAALAARWPETQGLLYMDCRDEAGWKNSIERIIDTARRSHTR